MRILFLGDVMGRAGRAAVTEHLPRLRDEWRLDFVVINGENASNGMGLSGDHAKVLFDAGADCVTLGDHAFDQKDMLQHIESDSRIIRPLNFAKNAPGKGYRLFNTRGGKKVLVVQALGQVFMKRAFDDPFGAVEAVLQKHPRGGLAQAIIVDMHCEATSEKMAMGHFCNGKASLVVGTHTHIPTGDAQILEGGTAYLTDAGMCGDYDSVIGMDKAEPMRRFLTGMPKGRFTPANGPATLSGRLCGNRRPHGCCNPCGNGAPRRPPAAGRSCQTNPRSNPGVKSTAAPSKSGALPPVPLAGRRTCGSARLRAIPPVSLHCSLDCSPRSIRNTIRIGGKLCCRKRQEANKLAFSVVAKTSALAPPAGISETVRRAGLYLVRHS